MAEEMYQWSSATYNVGSADNIPGKMTEWSRGTVADGKWLNRVTIIPFSGRDEYLLESINDIHDKKQPKLTNDNAGYGISIDAESEEIENAIIKLNPIDTSNIGYVSGNNNEIGFALSADITANSITAQDLTLVNLVVDNVTAYNTSAHNISGVSAIEGSTAAGLEPTIYGFKSINGTTLSSTNISGPTLTKNTDNIINATNVVESNSANWSNLSAIQYYDPSNNLTQYTTTNGKVTFSSNNINMSTDDNNNLLLSVHDNFGKSYYNFAVNGNNNSYTASVQSPLYGDVGLGNASVTVGSFAWGTYGKHAKADNGSIALKGATADNGSIAIKGATADNGSLAIFSGSTADFGSLSIYKSTADYGSMGAFTATASQGSVAIHNSTASYGSVAIHYSTADRAAFAGFTANAENKSHAMFDSTASNNSIAILTGAADDDSLAMFNSDADTDSVALMHSNADENSLAFNYGYAAYTAIANVNATADNNSIAQFYASATTGSIAIKGGLAASNSIANYGATATNASIASFDGIANIDSIAVHGGNADSYSIAGFGGNANNHSIANEGGIAKDYSIATIGGSATNKSIATFGSSATDNSIALGDKLYVTTSAIAMGRYNLTASEIDDQTPIFTIGNGTNNDNRSNAFVVYNNGAISASQYMGIESVANSYYNISKKLSQYTSDTLNELNNGAVALGYVSPCSDNLTGCFAWGTNGQNAKVSAFSIGFNGTAYNHSLAVKGSYADNESVAIMSANATNTSLASLCAGAQEQSMAILNATANNASYAFLSGNADTHSIAGLNAYANGTSVAINYAVANNQSIALELASADNNSLAIKTASADRNSLALLNSVADRSSIAIRTASADNSSIAEWNSSANNSSVAIYNTTANAASLGMMNSSANNTSIAIYNTTADSSSLGIMYSTADNTSIAIQNSNANRNSIAIRSSTADYTSVAIQNASANNNALAMISSTANDYSVAIGPGTYADTSAYIIGKYNAKTATTSNKTLLFAVGNGTSDTNRKNAFEVYTDGSIYAPNLNIDTTKWEYGTDDEYRPISFANSTYKSSYDASQTFYGSMVYDRDVTNGLRYNPVNHQLSVSAISANKLNLGDNCDIVFGNNTKSSLKQQIGITTGRSSKEIIWTFNNNSHDSSAYLGFTYFNQPSIDTATATNRINDGIGGWFYFGGQDIDTNGTPTVDCYSTTAEGYGVIAKAYSASEYYLGNSKISDLINAAGSKAYVNGTTLML